MKLYRWNPKTLEMIKIHYSKLIIGLTVIILWCFISFYFGYDNGFDSGKKSKITENDVILIYHDIENQGFSKRNFYEYLKEVNIKFPELVFAQAYKESGFKSPIWKNNRNPFGMKEATKRSNLQNGVQLGHAYYDTWKNAVVDYALYQSYIGLSKMKTEDEYLSFLKDMNYYDTNHPGNVDYLKDLKYIRNHIEDYLK